MKSHFLFYGLLIFALLGLFQLSKFWVFGNSHGNEILVFIVALVSIVLGIYFGKNKSSKLKESPEKENQLNQKKIQELNISSREFEVLELISRGHSNKEIGEILFLSESTIKTHVSNLLGKLDAKRRTQAVTISKDLGIIK